MNAFIVSDAFAIHNRGLILVPGFKVIKNKAVRLGDNVNVKMKNTTTRNDFIKAVSLHHNDEGEYIHIILGGTYEKAEIVGAEITHIPAQPVDVPGPATRTESSFHKQLPPDR